MAISNTSILIKRSNTTGRPGSLNAGEFAYSYKSNTLFIGTPDGNGVVNVGGQYYTSTIDASTNANTISTLVKRDNNGAFAGRLFGNSNTATALLNARNFSVSGNDIIAGTVGFDGTGDVVLNAYLTNIPGLVASTYGSATKIPVIGVAANGRVTTISTASVATNLNITANTGSNAISLLTDTLTFGGVQGITTKIVGQQLVIGTDSTITRSNTAGIGVQTIGTDLSITGNLIVQGATTTVSSSIISAGDTLLQLGANNTTGDVVDIGFYSKTNKGNGTIITGLIRDAGDKNYYLFDNISYNDNQGALDANILSSNLYTANLATIHTNIFAPNANITSLQIQSANVTGDLHVGGDTYLNTIQKGTWNGTTIAVAVGGTGTTTSTGYGSVVLNTNPSFSGTATFGTINVGVLFSGTQNFPASGLLGFLEGNANTYEQFLIQNSNYGSNASVDYIVQNDLGTDTTYYGDFGMNSSGFKGDGSFHLPNAVYVQSANGDLVLGTSTANSIHFVVNNGFTDAMTIDGTTGVVSLGSALPVTSGGTGRTSATANGIIYGAGTNAYNFTAMAGVNDQTWSNQILTVTNAGVPVWSTAMDGGQF